MWPFSGREQEKVPDHPQKSAEEGANIWYPLTGPPVTPEQHAQ